MQCGVRHRVATADLKRAAIPPITRCSLVLTSSVRLLCVDCRLVCVDVMATHSYASAMDVTALLLYYRQRMEQDLQTQQLLFDIATQCHRVCSTPPAASDALLDSLLPPYSPTSLSSLADCHLPTSSPLSSPVAPVRSGRGRHCLDLCINHYVDVISYTRRRMGRTVEELVRMERARERRRERERNREVATLLAAVTGGGPPQRPSSSASRAGGEQSLDGSAKLTNDQHG